MSAGDMAGGATGGDQVIFPAEAEAFVQELNIFTIADIGSERWSHQRERLEKLNMQAVHNATQQADEFVKEYLVIHEKFPILVHELLAVEIWRERVFPLMLQHSRRPTTSFPAYLVLYHEGTVASLIETAFFYQESCQSAEECVLDLLDYCYRKLTSLLAGRAGGGGVEELRGREEEEESDDSGSEDEGKPSPKDIVKELRDQCTSLSFSIAMKTISILNYITDHLSVLPLSVTTRLLNTHDIPCLLVSLVELAPWKKTGEKGELLRYENNHWSPVAPGERFRLGKVEGQVWLTLYRTLLLPDCQQKYEINSASKQVLMKLRSYLSEPLLEQVAQLGELQRYLEHLSFMDPPLARRDLILEQVPVIYDKLAREHSGAGWATVAQRHAKRLLEPSPEEIKSQAKRWVDSYNFDVLESLVSGPPKCALCGAEATKRCSRCRNEWYCGRECQVKHWKKHKASCDMLNS